MSFNSSWWPSRTLRRYLGIQTMCKFNRYLECLDLFNFLILILYHYLQYLSSKNERENKGFTFIPGLKSEVFPFTLIIILLGTGQFFLNKYFLVEATGVYCGQCYAKQYGMLETAVRIITGEPAWLIICGKRDTIRRLPAWKQWKMRAYLMDENWRTI